MIGALHTLIFAVFEFPSNFLLGESQLYSFYCKIVLYAVAIGVSFSHQAICRTIGLKKNLLLGLLFNAFGLATLWLNHYIGGFVALIFLDMVFFGAALTSVINALVTYVIIEMPKHVGSGIIVLFACFNGGVMLAPLLIDVFKGVTYQNGIYAFLLLLLAISTLFVARYFIDPPYPAHLKHLRKGTLVWKELHYRLGLIFAAIIFYGLTENTFNLWGFVRIASHLGQSVANETISFFWLFLIIGQIVLLIPLYFFPARKVFYFLIAVLIADLYFFAHQRHLYGLLAGLMIGGFCCSVVFPILLSMIEKDLVKFGKGKHILPYIETSVSVLMAGYFIGVGTIDLWIDKLGENALPSRSHYYMAMGYMAMTGLIALFLNLTAPKRSA
jgi:hypothetical protein